jgi:nicotinamidase/pyrazinamidase
MARLPLVFVDVDTQRDFLDPKGALYVPGAERILPNLARLTRFACAQHIPVLATACAHAPDDSDPEPFAPHCLIGTSGAERVVETAWPDTTHVARDALHTDGIVPHLTLHKRYYDAFTHPDAERIVALYNRERPRFVVYGVTTDYCVRAMVDGLLARHCRVALVADAILPIDPAAEAGLLTAFAKSGVLLTLTEVVCGRGLEGG